MITYSIAGTAGCLLGGGLCIHKVFTQVLNQDFGMTAFPQNLVKRKQELSMIATPLEDVLFTRPSALALNTRVAKIKYVSVLNTNLSSHK